MFRVSPTLDRSSLFPKDDGHDLLLGSAVWTEECGGDGIEFSKSELESPQNSVLGE